MKRIALLSAILLAALVTGVSFAAPPQSSKTPSLGDLARQLRAEREKDGAKPAKVFTNDNIPKSGGITTGATGESGEATQPTTGEGSSEEKPKEGAHDEKYYHEKMTELQAQKEMHQRELEVLEKKQSQGSMQYYSDPTKQMMQESNPGTYREDINKTRDNIEKKKQQIAADEQAITNLEEQCQNEGCPPGWLR
jgi:hypothetical protein